MNVAAPYTAICPTLDSEVLVALARTRKAMTGREVARLTGRRTHAGVLGALTRLVDQGVVEREEAGRALLFSLNRDHLAAPAVDVLAGMRAELLRRMRESVTAWEVKPVHISLFGSFARGDGDTRSDIDIFVVRPDGVSEDDAQWRTQLDELITQTERWTGNHGSVAEVGEHELERLCRGNAPIIHELRKDALILSGTDVVDLLGAA